VVCRSTCDLCRNSTPSLPSGGGLAAAAVGHELALADLVGNLPLVVRVEGRFRLHALWEDALSKRAGRDERTAARERASALLVRRGELVAAMRLVAEERHWPGMRIVIRAAFSSGQVPVPPTC
jgi:hypothetical protein